jgi:hypothetical protein
MRNPLNLKGILKTGKLKVISFQTPVPARNLGFPEGQKAEKAK